MKNNISGNVVICDVGESKSFGMKVNAKAYSILVSGIYQYKIEAIVRELSTNAVDSEKEARNLVPYDVHLPTHEEPLFSIRDYGTGISKEDLEEIYFNFFASTKEDNNDATGFIGIGSKSPLSYNTKSFNVESWKDGQHCIYLCFIGKDGVPDYNLVHEGESDEPNGLKVSLPVNVSDIYEFECCARKVYRWFDIKPNFIDKSVDISDPCIFRNDVYGIYNESKTIALMGNIAYPINRHPALDKYQGLVDKPIVLFFDIGDIEFNAAREGLEYTNRTIKRLKEKFDEVFALIENDMNEQIAAAKSTFGAIQKFIKLKYDVGRSIACTSFLKNDFEYNGETITVGAINVRDCECRRIYPGRAPRETHTLLIGHKDIYVHNDLKVGATSRCRQYAKEHQADLVLLNVNSLPIDIDESCYILASSLPKVVRQGTTSTRQRITSFMLMENNDFITKCWSPADINSATSKFYVIRSGYRVTHDNREYSPSEIYNRLQRCGFKAEVYGINKRDEEDLIAAGFVNAIEFTKREMVKLFEKTKNELPFAEEFKKLDRLRSDNSTIFYNLSKVRILLSPDHDLYQYANMDDYLGKNRTKYDEIIKNIHFLRCNNFDINVPQGINQQDITQTKKKYALLNNYFSDPEHMYYYILGVDYANSRQEL